MEYRIRAKRTVLPHIADGSKNLEIRVADSRQGRVKVGDTLIFEFGGKEYRRRVNVIRRYNSFEQALEREDINRIMPGWSRENILGALTTIYSKDKESLGVIVFELETID